MPRSSNFIGRLLSKSAFKVDLIWDKRILYKRFLLYIRITITKPVPVLRRPVDVAERAVVRHVLRDEADLVHGVVVEAVLQYGVNR